VGAFCLSLHMNHRRCFAVAQVFVDAWEVTKRKLETIRHWVSALAEMVAHRNPSLWNGSTATPEPLGMGPASEDHAVITRHTAWKSHGKESAAFTSLKLVITPHTGSFSMYLVQISLASASVDR
jgi:hypothetical protein